MYKQCWMTSIVRTNKKVISTYSCFSVHFNFSAIFLLSKKNNFKIKHAAIITPNSLYQLAIISQLVDSCYSIEIQNFIRRIGSNKSIVLYNYNNNIISTLRYTHIGFRENTLSCLRDILINEKS